MAASPRWKIYNALGRYVGCMKDLEDCAKVVAGMEDWTIRDGHKKIVWTEGSEEVWAGESYDRLSEIVWTRIVTH